MDFVITKDRWKRAIPKLNIYIVFFSIILNPFIKLGPIQFWMLSPFVLLLLNLNFTFEEIRSIRNFLPFIIYVSLHFIISLFFQGFDSATLGKFFLFFAVYLAFLIILAKNVYFTNHSDEFEKIINAIILIVGIYGIYQFIARQLNLPFTFNEVLRFRNWKIGGFYQVSSFFEEPAFFSQFLVVLLFIHLFIFNVKYIRIIILIIINIIFTISVTGVASLFIILILFFISRLPRRINLVVNKRKFIMITSFVVILIVFLTIISTSRIGHYVSYRVKGTFINKEKKEQLLLKQKVSGGSAGYDRSGYLRIVDEYTTLIEVVTSDDFLFGYGINYSEKLPQRNMGLNAITEFTVRWGILGLFLFLFPLLLVLMNYSKWVYGLIFIFIYFTIDGAIAKLSFLFILSLFLSAFIIYKNKTNQL
jgi:hypothetical protein